MTLLMLRRVMALLIVETLCFGVTDVETVFCDISDVERSCSDVANC